MKTTCKLTVKPKLVASTTIKTIVLMVNDLLLGTLEFVTTASLRRKLR